MSSFSAGQVWTMTGAQSASTRIVVGEVDRHGLDTIVHVSILNVLVPEDIAPGGHIIGLAHMPFQEDALARSVGALERGGESPHADFSDAMATWAQEEKAHAYSIVASDAIAQIFQALRDK